MTQQRGFSLIELAIVLVIVTLLIGGLAVPLSAQIQARRIAETRQTMQEAREALFGYAMSHPAISTPSNRYLPCPDTTGDGHEDRVSDTQCSAYQGFLPWADLGAASQDAWGNRLGYAVVVQFIDRSNGFSASSPPPRDHPQTGLTRSGFAPRTPATPMSRQTSCSFWFPTAPTAGVHAISTAVPWQRRRGLTKRKTSATGIWFTSADSRPSQTLQTANSTT